MPFEDAEHGDVLRRRRRSGSKPSTKRPSAKAVHPHTRNLFKIFPISHPIISQKSIVRGHEGLKMTDVQHFTAYTDIVIPRGEIYRVSSKHEGRKILRRI